MAWTALKPPLRRSKPVWGSAYVRRWDNGSLRIVLSLTKALHDKLGNPSHCSIEAGDGEDLGRLRLVPDTGAFAITKNGHRGAVKITLEPWGDVGASPAPKAPIDVTDDLGTAVIIALPLARWAGSAAPRPASKPAAPPPAPSQGSVDPYAYLQAKGHGAERWTGGRHKLDGEIVTSQQLLHRVNLHRAKADLPALTVEQLKL